MYPRRELSELAARKALLQARIAVHRAQCLDAAEEIARPLALVDRGLALWRRVSPMVKLLTAPAGLLLTQWLKRRAVGAGATKTGKFAAVMSALPMILRGVKMVQQMRGAKREHQPAGAD